MDILGKLKEWLTMGVVPLGGVVVASGIVLFAPNALLLVFGLDSVVADIRPYLGGAFILSFSLLLCMFGKGVWDSVLRGYIRDTLAVRMHLRELRGLTEDEKQRLRPYIEQQTRSHVFSMHGGVAMGLQQRGIIIRISSIGLPGSSFAFPFQIQPWAWEYLNEHPDLLAPAR